jgi:hypothetical protein
MPASLSFPPRLPQGCSAALILLLCLTACESERRPPAGAPTGPGGPAAEAATPEMEASGTFFSGEVEVETLLNRGGFSPRVGSAGGGDSDSGAGGGSGRRGGGGGGRGGGGRGRGASASPASAGSGEGTGADPAPRIYASNLPAVRLHLRLTNHGASPVDIEVTDFDSDLGNFVVQPEKITLPPGESVEADPMTSRLGVNSDTIPLKVTLRSGDKSETQVLNLHLIKPAAPSGSAPGST